MMSLVTPQSSVAADGPIPTVAGEHAPVDAQALDLRIHRAGTPDRRLRIQVDRCTLGSGEGCTVRLADPAVCPLHAVILSAAGRVLIRGYAIPLEINGHFAIEAFLKPGDVFHLGSYRFEILSVPTHAHPQSGFETGTAGAESTLRAQWLRTQQRLESLTQRYQETLESLEQAREEGHQARRQIESLQRECRDRVDLQTHQARAHAEELQGHADQVSQLQFEVLRLRSEIDRYRIQLELSEREQERFARRESQLASETEAHEADRANWTLRLAELSQEVQRLRTERDTKPLPSLTARAVADVPRPVASPSTESVESRMSHLLARIGKLTEESLDPLPHRDAEPHAAHMSPTDEPLRSRPEPHRDRKPTDVLAPISTEPSERHAWPAAIPSAAMPAVSMRPRWDRLQFFVLPILAVLFFGLGNRLSELSLVWNTAGGLTCGLMAFFAYDIWRELSLARWTAAANPHRHRPVA
jgi:hypothetical protein